MEARWGGGAWSKGGQRSNLLTNATWMRLRRENDVMGKHGGDAEHEDDSTSD